MQTQLTILAFFLVLVLSSCHPKTAETETGFKKIVTDTSISHKLYNEVDFSRSFGTMLNLPKIDEGVDSFELRIWVTGILSTKTLIISKCEGDEWNSLVYLFQYDDDNGLDTMNVYSFDTPREISNVVAHLKQKEILALPSQQSIPNFLDGVRDGRTYTIEVSTKSFYKALQYHCPELYANEPSNAKFMNLIKYLNLYFKFCPPYSKARK